MLDGFPNLHYFNNGNSYSGSHVGMRYFVEPQKLPDPADETGKKKIMRLLVTLWPEPWSLEHTAPEKCIRESFEGSAEGLKAAVEWIGEQFYADTEKWSRIPSILDVEPDIPDPTKASEEK